MIEVMVECNAGLNGEDLPKSFFIKDQRYDVITIVDQWLAPEHRYLKVKTEDEAIYILRHDTPSSRWELVLFDQKGALS